GSKVLVPISQFTRTLIGARLASDVLDVPTLLIARTAAPSATLLTSDVDPHDQQFLTGERTPKGDFRVRGGVDAANTRGLAYMPYAEHRRHSRKEDSLGNLCASGVQCCTYRHGMRISFPVTPRPSSSSWARAASLREKLPAISRWSRPSRSPPKTAPA